MDTKKLDKWADLLLDTGKRNNLINFKDTRTSTVEVLLPSSDVLFEKVDGTASFEVFDPKIVEEDDDTEESYAPEQLQIGAPEESSESEQLQIEISEKSDASDGKAAFLAQYSGKIKRQELLCRGWFLPPNTYDCGSFVVNGTAVVGKEQNNPYNC